MDLWDLEIYKLSREISRSAWGIYAGLSWQDKKVMGDQFIRAIDSVSANIAESFGRFHYLDKNKFCYNARGSLFESLHWLDVLFERGKVKESDLKELNNKLNKLQIKLNNYITSTRKLSKK